MFKFLKKKPVQTVVRVEDLQIGDVMQYDLLSRGKVKNIILLPEKKWNFPGHPMYDVTFTDATPGNHINRQWRIALFGNLQVFVWK
jgi:hypothetical protein